jgi:hypothetical protein
VNERSVRLVLDASAIVAFTRESIHVGEVIAEVDDGLGAFGLPALCLVEAAPAIVDTDRLDVLVNHRASALLRLDAAKWPALAAMHEIVGAWRARPPR